MELWKDIEGYEGRYQVSNIGRVKSLGRFVENPIHGLIWRKEKIMSPARDKGGYRQFTVCKSGSQRSLKLHRIVGFLFVNNPDPANLPDINHNDGNKDNNAASNLSWTNDSLNGQHAWDTGLRTKRFGKDHWASKAVVQKDLNGKRLAMYGSIKEAGRQTGICDKNINSSVLKKKNHATAGGYQWEYA